MNLKQPLKLTLSEKQYVGLFMQAVYRYEKKPTKDTKATHDFWAGKVGCILRGINIPSIAVYQ